MHPPLPNPRNLDSSGLKEIRRPLRQGSEARDSPALMCAASPICRPRLVNGGPPIAPCRRRRCRLLWTSICHASEWKWQIPYRWNPWK
uniref:Uncharacterized protein n=1 Tax=Arundo donax TaxID=35708 RepID=A0A0A9CUG5_ARUDO